MRIKEGTRERKVPRAVGTGAIGVVEVRDVGIATSITSLGSSRVSVTHTHSLGFVLTILIRIRNLRPHDRLILRILKDFLRSLIKRQICIRPSGGKTRNG